MKYALSIVVLLVLITACTPKTATLDDARQIAVNRIMTDDNYVQNDGYDFKELEAKTLDCEGCFAFRYEYKINQEYSPGFDGYVVDVTMKNDIITSVLFAELRLTPADNTTPIVDRFDEFCENKCGDGFCNDVVCQDVDCTCEESKDTCPEDCGTIGTGGPTQYGVCGDEVCDYGENTSSYPYYCPEDC